MGIRALSEAIILQSLEDLSDPGHRIGSMEFFSGEGFRICAEMAGLGAQGEANVLRLVREINSRQARTAERSAFRLRRLPSAAPLSY